MSVTPIHMNAGPAHRAKVSVNGLTHVVSALDELSMSHEFTSEQLQQIDDAEMRLALIRARGAMRASMAELCGKFGKGVP